MNDQATVTTDNEELQAAFDAVDVAEETMLGDLMSLVIQELKVMPKSWPEMSESQQEEVIYRAEQRCKSAIKKATRIISSRNHKTVLAQVEQVVFKDGAKAVLKGFGPGFHDLADAINETVMVVIPETEPSLEHAPDVQADKDQAELPLTDAAGEDQAKAA